MTLKMRLRLPNKVTMPRRPAVLLLALVALLVAAVPVIAAKPKKSAGPTVRAFSPTKPEIGGKLTLHGKRFAKKRSRNTVVLRAPNGGSTFLKPISASKRKLVVRLRSRIGRLMAEKAGLPVATRFRVRVLAGKKFGPWTKKKRSPVIRPSGKGGGAGGDCDDDGRQNAVDDDDDNDLLSDAVETDIKTDVCLADTDQDQLEDGFEYESALNLNNDEDQEPNTSLPYPGKRPYPNPLDPSDASKDFDGDSLTLSEEHTLWKFSISKGYAVRTLDPLYYSDGEQYSINEHCHSSSSPNCIGPDDRRVPALAAAGYEKQVNFLDWASANGYRTVMLEDGPPWYAHSTVRNPYGLLDFNRDGVETDSDRPEYRSSETHYYDNVTADGWLDDSERDEDADGLTNGDELHRWMSPAWWAQCYASELPFHLGYQGTDVLDPDTDGDGVRDGADDQDHDDIPNVLELSRNLASGLDDTKNGRECLPADNLGAGNFEVIGGPLPNSSIDVFFRNQFSRVDVPQMTATNSLSGGSAPTVTVSTVQDGGITTDEIQRVTITGAPDGGNFTLTLSGQTTASIGFDATADTVDGALEAIFPAAENTNHPNAYGRMDPFNPCLPARFSRTCPRVVNSETGAPFDDSLNWAALN
jgi:hypothetical protein